MKEYIIRIGDMFYAKHCRSNQSSEYPDATIFRGFPPALRVARELLKELAVDRISVWENYGMADAQIVWPDEMAVKKLWTLTWQRPYGCRIGK